MNPDHWQTTRQASAAIKEWPKQTFDIVAAWVTQLSWWKFILFAILMLIAGSILQDTLFSEPEMVVVHRDKPSRHANVGHKIMHGDGTTINIDNTGIHIFEKKKSDTSSAETAVEGSSLPTPPTPPAAPTPPAPSSFDVDDAGVHVTLPPEVGKEVSDAIDEAVDDAAEQKVAGYRRKSSEWFKNFVLLLVVGLFGTKALMGGKKRAEAQALAANAAAERETLQRQVSEAKLQMMQAQVEPHFLFNTLASVEHLIETDPPRAAAMQHSLIQYLRAVLPQMRENAAVTNLGREADMVRAYLDLLKMRMEERLTVDFQVPEGLRSAAFPPMMLQSLIENAIQHGLEGKPEGGTLRVLAEVAHNNLRVTVADDGMGFGAVKSNGTGLGLQNIRERLKLLHGQKAQLIIAPNTPSGVSVTIEVPYQLAQ